MRWQNGHDEILVAEVRRASSVAEALDRVSRFVGARITKDMANNRLRRLGHIGGMTGLLGTKPEDIPDIPIVWEDEATTSPDLGTVIGNTTSANDNTDDGSVQRILIIPDCHHPFVDRRAWALMLRCAAVFRPHRVVLLGDFADFYSVSFHSKDPRRVSLLEHEVDATNDAFDDLDAIPGVEYKDFVEGNHEYRLERYLMERAPALLGHFKVRELFKLEQRGWTYTPYREYLKVGKMYFTHELGQAGMNAHRGAGASFEGSVCIGHTHRMGTHYWGNTRGESHVANMFGWLGSTKDADYMHRVKAERDWHLGFGIGWMLPSGVVHTSPVPIIDYRAVINGQVITSP